MQLFKYRTQVLASIFLTGTIMVSTLATSTSVFANYYDTGTCTGVQATRKCAANFDETNDTINGSEGTDYIFGYGGNDTLNGHGGNDVVFGNMGNDTVAGYAGNDIIYGGKDQDNLYGNDGSDTIYGDLGSDNVYGGKENDTLIGFDGDDNIFGELGDDLMYGNKGNDRMQGGDGNDRMHGGKEQDIVYGGSGNDVLYGDLGGADLLLGQDGDDTMYIVPDLTAGSSIYPISYANGGPGSDNYVIEPRMTVSRAQILLHEPTPASGETNTIVLGDQYAIKRVGEINTESAKWQFMVLQGPNNSVVEVFMLGTFATQSKQAAISYQNTDVNVTYQEPTVPTCSDCQEVVTSPTDLPAIPSLPTVPVLSAYEVHSA